MAICPAGHSSAAADYCDVCGARIGTAPSTPAAGAAGGAPGAPAQASGGVPGGACPDCGTPRSGRFCENCGYDHVIGGGRPTPQAPPPPTAARGTGPAPMPGSVPGAAPGSAPGGVPAPGPGGLPGSVPDQEAGTVTWTPPGAVPGPAPDQEAGTTAWASTGSGPDPAAGTAVPGAGAYGTGVPEGGVPGAAAQAEEEEPVTRDWTPSPGHFPRPAVEWAAVVTADRDHYDRVVIEGGDYAFPPYAPDREIPLTGTRVRIGRRSVSQGTVPEIDLAEPPADPGVSHTHAVLLAKPDGTWTLVDPGSTNGTTMNGGDEPIPVNVEVPLRDGDRVHLGVWTTIILRRLR